MSRAVWLYGDGANRTAIIINRNLRAGLAGSGEFGIRALGTAAVTQRLKICPNQTFCGADNRGNWWGGINRQRKVPCIAGVACSVRGDSR